ncbi:carotenoid isomerooxygenase isoform X2 [Cryptotermes secundus]|uniref:carotenoid isomerooxygenase isoform X2 n=1 Tax=Cryptotermes secundus TaxID=105785 RepID=UPI001454BA77|nr:carotenoid isomerooxygenase isoform X2 [Cryptotermes secundus]
MSNKYISDTNYRNSCNFWADERMKDVANSENDNFTPVINYSTSDNGWSTPTNGWATPSSGYGTPVGVGTPSCRRRILAGNHNDEIYSTSDSGWATPSSGYGSPVGIGTPSCRRRILVENHKSEIYSTSHSGWATPSSGYGSPVGVGTPSCRRRILGENHKSEIYSTSDSGWSTPTNGWATPSSGYGTPVGVGTPSCRRRILAGNHNDEIYVEGSCPGQGNKDESIRRGDSEEASGQVKGIDSICSDRDASLLRKLQTGEDLYPFCDASVWLRSCSQEVVEPLEGKITGCIPYWLKGSLLRNGPGSLKVGDMTFGHLFDGSALLHRFAIDGGHVTYQSRFLKTQTYKRNMAAQRIVVTEFGTKAVPDPCQTIFQRVSALFTPGETTSDNAMISVYPFGDELYALTEYPVIHRFDPITLDTLDRVNVSKYVGIVNHTSHPHVMDDGTVYNLGMSISVTGPHYAIIKFPPTCDVKSAGDGCSNKRLSMFEQARIIGSIPARWPLHPAYMHTFGSTENYFVIVEQPLSVSVPAMVRNHLLNEPMAGSFRWYQDQQFHCYTIKALLFGFPYEESDSVAAFVEQGIQKNPDYARMFRGRPLRFVLPLKNVSSDTAPETNLVTLQGAKATAYRLYDGNIFSQPELLCDLGCETPRIYYEKYLGQPYRYFYAISCDVDADNPGTLIKVDIKTRTKMTWCEENVYPSEPIFVPSPDPKEEDDGVVLSALVWGRGIEREVGILVLDASTWQELSRATFTTPSPVPKCLHGWFTENIDLTFKSTLLQ